MPESHPYTATQLRARWLTVQSITAKIEELETLRERAEEPLVRAAHMLLPVANGYPVLDYESFKDDSLHFDRIDTYPIPPETTASDRFTFEELANPQLVLGRRAAAERLKAQKKAREELSRAKARLRALGVYDG